MTTKGIIFSAPMVRALLAGRKTQTRRLLTPGTSSFGSVDRTFWDHANFAEAWADHGYLHVPAHADDCAECREKGWDGTFHRLYPNIEIGDRLYVRENWQALSFGDYQPTKHRPADVRYAATDPCADLDKDTRGYPWRPCIHMPRWASRLWLEVSEVRVQRLQDISEGDAVREGVTLIEESLENPVEAYHLLWDSLHTKPGTRWQDNPWIVAVSFAVHQGNVDA